LSEKPRKRLPRNREKMMIDPQLKENLMSALSESVDEYNKSKDAVGAIYKAADAKDFNIEQTRRLCEMFNTAKTLYHYTANPEKRAERFEVVDPDRVIEKLFCRTNEGKKLATTDLDISDEYSVPERDFVEKGDTSEVDMSWLEEDQPSELDLLNRYLPESMTKTEVVKLAFTQSVESNPLADGWCSAIRKAASMLETASQLRAEAAMLESDVSGYTKKALNDVYGGDELEDDSFEGMLKRAAEDKPKNKPSLLNQLTSGVRQTVSEPVKPIAGAVGGAAKDYLQTGIKNMLKSKADKDMKGVEDYHKSQHNSIILEELMNTDPVLSSMDPKKVAETYLVLMDIAPESASNKAVARSMLRQMVHSDAFSAYDANTVATLDKTLNQIRGMVRKNQDGEES
jgi:hypothetical protein